MIYALIDGQRQIDVAHLQAGLAVWEYCETSAARIFGNATGDPIADDIVEALRGAGPEGLSRNSIRDLFGRHQSSDRIGASLAALLRRGTVQAGVHSTGGRPVEMWFLNG